MEGGNSTRGLEFLRELRLSAIQSDGQAEGVLPAVGILSDLCQGPLRDSIRSKLPEIGAQELLAKSDTVELRAAVGRLLNQTYSRAKLRHLEAKRLDFVLDPPVEDGGELLFRAFVRCS